MGCKRKIYKGKIEIMKNKFLPIIICILLISCMNNKLIVSADQIEWNLNNLNTPTSNNTASATALYDPCIKVTQVFEAILPEPTIITGEIRCRNRNASTRSCTVLNTTTEPSYPEGIFGEDVYFSTRKCMDESCTTVKSTDAYPYAIHMSDGAHSTLTYIRTGVWSDKGVGTTAVFTMKPYGTTDQPFAITGISIAVNGPGTYVIYAFTEYDERYDVVPTLYTAKFYVTVDEKSDPTCLLLPTGLKEIQSSAFEGSTAIRQVTIPNGVTTIGSRAFANCTNLTLVNIPSSVTSIGANAFLNAPNLVLNCQSNNVCVSYAQQNGISYRVQ